MDLYKIEVELKKRLNYPYIWGRKQGDDWDAKTKFIYSINYFEKLQNEIKHLSNGLKNYALNRWYNFLSAKAIEYIFKCHPNVEANKNIYDKQVDFILDGISFDHKTSIFPKNFRKSYDHAIQNKKELIVWLYQNQSKQGRMHFENRLFVIVCDRYKLEHWKLKAEILFLKQKIDFYIDNFKREHLTEIDYNNKSIFSDIIFIEK